MRHSYLTHRPDLKLHTMTYTSRILRDAAELPRQRTQPRCSVANYMALSPTTSLEQPVRRGLAAAPAPITMKASSGV